MARGARLAAFFLILIGTLAAPVRTEACSCIAARPVCEAFWQAPVVFAGEVLEITDIEQPSDPAAYRFLGSRKVKMRVDRAFRGTKAGTIEVQTGSSDADCGFPFERGGRYLVFAEVRGERITASQCGRTKALADAAADLAYVSQTFTPSAGGRVYGEVKAGSDEQRLPAPGYKVQVTGAGRQWTATTDAAGAFEIKDVPAGKFKIGVVVADGEFAYGGENLELADARGCASADFTVVANGRVVLKVLKAPSGERRPQLQMIDADTLKHDRPQERYPWRGPSLPETGEMEWAQLPPGRYLIGVNLTSPPTPEQPYPRTFYPGVSDPAAALVIQVGLGERVELEPFTYPAPLRVIAIRGTVVRPDSRVVPGLRVLLLTSEGRFVTSAETDREGRFSFQSVEGGRYRVKTITPELTVESEPFELTPATAPILVVLRPPK